MLESGSINIQFSPPDITEDEISEVVNTLRSGWITTGPKTKLFERKIAEYCGTSKAVCLNSATAALELTLRILGIGEGDEVITTAYTYTASASVIHHVGAKIVLVDTAKNSYEMDYDLLEQAITNRTKAIIPVDLAGIQCDYDKLFEIVRHKKSLYSPQNKVQEAYNRVIIIADSAHAFGATRHNEMCGRIADFTCFSFHAVKNLTTSEGGAVTWRDIEGVENEDIYREYMLLSLHGQSKDALSKAQLGSWEYDIIYPAYKCNMTDIMASLGIAQLNRYSELLSRRKEIIEMYDKSFMSDQLHILEHFTLDYSSSGHLYMVRLLNHDTEYRNQFILELARKGIASNVHYKPLPMHTAYKNLGFHIEDYPCAYEMYKNEITLPLHTCLTNEQVAYVIDNFTKISRGNICCS